MPRWKTTRWTLGAPALVALAVAGCGAAASQPKLHSTSEKRLLSLVARARTDASNHNGSAVRADLGEFVADVKTLRSSGQLSPTTAGRLDRDAGATATQAAAQLHPKPAAQGTTAATATSVTQPADATTTAGHPDPPVKNTPPPAKPKPPKPNDRGKGDAASGPTWPDPGHTDGHGHGHGGWSSSQSGAYETNIAKAWAKWWKRVTGGPGD